MPDNANESWKQKALPAQRQTRSHCLHRTNDRKTACRGARGAVIHPATRRRGQTNNMMQPITLVGLHIAADRTLTFNLKRAGGVGNSRKF